MNVGENVGDVGENVGENVGDVGEITVNDSDARIAVLKLISENNKASATQLAKDMSVTQRTVERYLKELREEGRLIRHGSARGGHWEIVNK
ncbi:MAG: HTH domain-containing protein [Lachnospiraceae bacterium]|nr:HTH domain-containing protein [Lachnospiraceae bacterium]